MDQKGFEHFGVIEESGQNKSIFTTLQVYGREGGGEGREGEGRGGKGEERGEGKGEGRGGEGERWGGKG